MTKYIMNKYSRLIAPALADRGEIVDGWDEKEVFGEENPIKTDTRSEIPSIRRFEGDIFYTAFEGDKVINAILYADGTVEVSIGQEGSFEVQNLLKPLGNERSTLNNNEVENYVNSLVENEEFKAIDMSEILADLDSRTPQATIKERLVQEFREEFDEPEGYNNYLRATKYYRGVTGYLYHTNSYSVSQKMKLSIVAGDLLSAVSSLLGIASWNLMDLVWFARDASGIYKAATNTSVATYNIYQYGNKTVQVGSIYPYRAGRTRAWDGIIFDYGEGLNDRYIRSDYDYFDNNGLLYKGIDLHIEYGW